MLLSNGETHRMLENRNISMILTKTIISLSKSLLISRGLAIIVFSDIQVKFFRPNFTAKKSSVDLYSKTTLGNLKFCVKCSRIWKNSNNIYMFTLHALVTFMPENMVQMSFHFLRAAVMSYRVIKACAYSQWRKEVTIIILNFN